jgi:oligopeptide transport system ATP-binding protein
MNLLLDLQEQQHYTYLLIAHDLAVVKHMSDYIGVMYLGKVIELAESTELYDHPIHPYTQALFSSVMPNHPDSIWTGGRLSGEPPSPINPPLGCRFNPRCPRAEPRCAEIEPALTPISVNHLVACHRY